MQKKAVPSGKTALDDRLQREEPTPEPTPEPMIQEEAGKNFSTACNFQKAAGFMEKAAGFGEKAAGFYLI